jgi:NACHT conflict system protein
MSLGFTVAATKIGVPIAKFLIKNYLGEAAITGSSGLIDIAAQRITDEEQTRLASRQFEDIGDKIVRRLIPLFQDVEDGAAEAIGYEIGLTLAGNVSAEFFVARDLDPAKLGAALRAARPLPAGMYVWAG